MVVTEFMDVLRISDGMSANSWETEKLDINMAVTEFMDLLRISDRNV